MLDLEIVLARKTRHGNDWRSCARYSRCGAPIARLARYSGICAALFVQASAANLIVTLVYGQSNPVPILNQPVVPDAVAPGGPGFTLTLNGTGFTATSVVHWNGSPRQTTFVSPSQLRAAITPSDIAAASTASLSVVNLPPGGGTSNVSPFEVTSSKIQIGFSTIDHPIKGIEGVVQTIATADLNGDGKPDLVLADIPNAVDVLLGNGNGTFQAPLALQVGDNPECVVIADFNGDGYPDLGVCGSQELLYISLGNGDGTFLPFKGFPTEYESYSIAVGDFNGDGKLDLAATSVNTGNVNILLGNGDGTFNSNIPYPVGPSSTVGFVTTGDFNRDGFLDLAVSGFDSSAIEILLGNGDGSFQLPTSYVVGTNLCLTAADLNADGILDLVVPVASGTAIATLLGNGDGTFQPPQSWSAGLAPHSVVAGDFNGDGFIDIAVSNGNTYTDGGNSILFGNGDGSFRAPITTVAQPGAGFLISSDFNEDGNPDLATINSSTSTLSILLETSASISPGSGMFPTQVLKSTSSPIQLKLTNLGVEGFMVSGVVITGKNASDFAITENACTGMLVAPSGGCTIGALFTPSAEGLRTAAVEIIDNAAGAHPQFTPLSGNGTVLSFVPNTLSFGDVRVGKVSRLKVIIVTNEGTVTTSFNQIIVSGLDPSDFSESNTCGTTLPAGGSCSVELRFIPTANGSRSALVSFADNGGGSPQTVALAGVGN